MSVRIGMSMAAFPFSSPKAMWRWIDACEGGGVDSIWQTDRLVSSEPYLEPMTMMAALAAGTERMRFGMNVIVLPVYDPMIVAKQCATIDFLSSGRLVPAFGVGGDAAPEWRALGIDPRTRGKRTDEALTIISRLWAGETVSFEGTHYHYDGARIAPLPVQSPLPLWIGGTSEAAIRRTATVGTGWLAGGSRAREVGPVVEKIRAASAAAGRPIDADHYGAGFAFRFGSWEDEVVQRAAARLAPGVDPHELLAVGDTAAVLARVQEYLDAGISKFVLRPLASGDEDILDQTRRLIETVIPVVHTPRAV